MGTTDRLATSVAVLNSNTMKIEQTTVTSVNPVEVASAGQVPTLGWADPTIGDQVWVLKTGSTAICLGPAVPNQRPSGTGTVTNSNDNYVTATVDGNPVTVPRLASYTPTNGETCLIEWWPTVQATSGAIQWAGIAVGKVTAAPIPTTITKTTKTIPTPPTVDTSVPGGGRITVTVFATSSGTWRGTGWRTDTINTIQGNDGTGINSGFWFYGDGFTKYAGWIVVAATVSLRGTPETVANSPVHVRTHTSPTKTSTYPAGVSQTAFANFNISSAQNVEVSVPNTVAQALVDGTIAGIAITGDENAVLNGAIFDPASGSFTITLEKNS